MTSSRSIASLLLLNILGQTLTSAPSTPSPPSSAHSKSSATPAPSKSCSPSSAPFGSSSHPGYVLNPSSATQSASSASQSSSSASQATPCPPCYASLDLVCPLLLSPSTVVQLTAYSLMMRFKVETYDVIATTLTSAQTVVAAMLENFR